MKRGTIDPPMAENKRTMKVDSVCICVAFAVRLATNKAIAAARAADPAQAKTRARILFMTGTANTKCPTATMTAA